MEFASRAINQSFTAPSFIQMLPQTSDLILQTELLSLSLITLVNSSLPQQH